MITHTKEEYTTDILVIGGGIAAVFAATRASKNKTNVIVVDKGSIGRSGQTPFASAMAVFDEELGHKRDEWHRIVEENSKKLNNPAYLDSYMDYSKEIYKDLESWKATDVGFGGVLRKKLLEDKNIKIIERTMITTLLEENNVVTGAVGFSLDSEKAIVIKSKSVILCTGAGAFKPNGFQVSSLTFDGDAMAYRIGAKISGKEFVDTHDNDPDSPAYCWGQWQGMWSMGLPKLTEGPMEGGGQALDLTGALVAHKGLIPVEMPRPDGPPPGKGDGKQGPPNGERSDRPQGPPGGKEDREGDHPKGGRPEHPIGGASAGLSVHKAEGLFPSDNKCTTSIKGLYAAGDCLSSMLVGPIYNGVGGFSVMGSAVQGAVAGESSAKYVKNKIIKNISDEKITNAINEMFEPLNYEKGYSPGWVEHLIQGVLTPYYVLYIKEKNRLESALTMVEFYREHFIPRLKAKDLHDLRKAHEVKNMLLNAEMKLRSSLFRTESRGNHYREDYPESDDKNWLAWVVIKRNNKGEMELEKFNRDDYKKMIKS
ncbi:FAD-binding protein [uncultured Ilyobacter sp.]|uniref:FAD-binding protein n=1 Tax=uncultured Ilyobacter sp. TaxID=544433 RepID=UPI002AA602FF|nr:FAD-binding protein [uncultured Ilyobacter sp.]